MADQVNPVGSLAPGLPLTLQVAVKSQPAPEKPRSARPSDPPPKGPEGERVAPSAATLEAAVKDVQAFFEQTSSDLSFRVDESSGRLIFKVLDSKTKEVIRQVPSEEILAMARKLREMSVLKDASGVLVDKEG